MASNPIAVFFQSSVYGVGTIFFDLIESESHSYNNSITGYNIEDGSTISDHIKNELVEGSLSGMVTNFSINTRGLTSNRAQDAFDKLVQLWKAKELVMISTVHKIYENMGITAISMNKSTDDGEVLQASISFREVKKVSLKEVEIQASVKITDMNSAQNRQAAGNTNVGSTVPIL